MKIKLTRYCIMTADLKKVEVGQSREYHFILLKDLATSKTKIQLFNSYAVAKASFARSWSGVVWDERTKAFYDDRWNSYVIRKIELTYDIPLKGEKE